MNNFSSKSKQEYAGISAPYNKHKNATPILIEAGNIFKKFQKYSSNAGKLMNIDINNMEDVFCLADIIQVTSKGRNNIPEVDMEIKEIIKNIRLWLWKIFQQCPPINSKKQKAQKNQDKYKDFFQFLIDKHKQYKNISIITTNYDLMPEFFSLFENLNG